jgi:hypothetical protein
MSTTIAPEGRAATLTPHFKTRGFPGEHSLERCEDAGCTVGADGHADCGRVACPACGFSGSNLSEPDALGGLVGCSCGHVFETH